MSELRDKREIALVAAGPSRQIAVAVGTTPNGARVCEMQAIGPHRPVTIWIGPRFAVDLVAALTRAAGAIDASRGLAAPLAAEPPLAEPTSCVAPPWQHHPAVRERIARFNALQRSAK